MRNNRAYDLRRQSFSLLNLSAWQKCALAFIFLALMELPFLQIIQKKEESKNTAVVTAGDIEVVIRWPGCRLYDQSSPVLPIPCVDRVNVDVDLWLQSPDDDKPVGYSNKTAKTWSLLRDDLGTRLDSTDLNYENAFARGTPPGEYVINIKLYKNFDQMPEVPVDVVITKRAADGSMEPLLLPGKTNEVGVIKAVLRHEEEELTISRFTLDEKGALVESSVNDLQKELSTWKQH